MKRTSRQNANFEKVEREKELQRKVEEESEEGLAEIDAGPKGRGVTATKEFKVGEYVTTYKGELISHKDALAR